MTLVKICGITNLEDALSAVSAGADALGFNFYRPSSRYIEPHAAQPIIAQLPPHVLTVGVFVNEETPEAVENIANAAGVKAIQLHGDESPAFSNALSHRYVIKVFPVAADFNPQSTLKYAVTAHMVDAFDPQWRGGTGRIVDWSLARSVQQLVPRLFLAGGLTVENVGEAITQVRPYAVDACSSLEVRGGKKDAERVRAFIEAAHRVKP